MGKRDTEPLLRRGWVTSAEFDGKYYPWVRIAPDGLRILAEWQDEHGLPEMKGGTIEKRVCSDCGSSRWHYDYEKVEVPTP